MQASEKPSIGYLDIQDGVMQQDTFENDTRHSNAFLPHEGGSLLPQLLECV